MVPPLDPLGDEMNKQPCKECIVRACCLEVCDKLADFWSNLYQEYKLNSKNTIDKYNLEGVIVKTLQELHQSAGDKSITFKADGRVIDVKINFSLNPPQRTLSHRTLIKDDFQ